jgi:hypothetical protein
MSVEPITAQSGTAAGDAVAPSDKSLLVAVLLLVPFGVGAIFLVSA